MERTGDPGEDYAAVSPVADGDPGPSRRYKHLSRFSHFENVETTLILSHAVTSGRQNTDREVPSV